MPKNKRHKQKQIAKKVAKLIGATAALSPLVLAVPAAIGATVSSPGTLPVIITPIQTQITNQLAGQSLNVGDSMTIDLDHIFQDAGQLMYTIAVQNYNVAKVTIQSGNLHISMKKKGTTMVTVTARKADQTGIVLERFRLTAETPSTLDMNQDEQIRVDDIVKYMNVHPGKNVEDYKSLLNTVKPYIPIVNLAPVANHSEITNLNVPLNGSIALSMDDFFSDEDGDLLSYRISPAMPSYGLNVNAYISSNILTITGQSYSSQALTITVEANDQQSTPTSTATHQFQVKVDRAAPIALPDTYSVSANSTLTVNAATGVLHNDLEYNDSGLNLIAIKETDPTHGTLSMFMDGGFVYTPQSDFAGTDSFTYKVWDGNKYSGAVTVYIYVAAVNHAPVLLYPIMNQLATVNKPFHLQLPANTFTDADLNTLTYSLSLSNSEIVPDWLVFDPNTLTFSGTPTNAGEFSLRLTATDGMLSATADFDLTVNLNSPPLVSADYRGGVHNDGHFNLREGQKAAINLNQIFTDIDDDELVFNHTAGSYSEFEGIGLTNGILSLAAGSPSGGLPRVINVSASDGNHGTVTSYAFTATVVSSTYGNIPDITIPNNSSHSTEILLDHYFDVVPDGSWSFSATTNNANVSATILGNTLSLRGLTNGVSSVAVVMNDGHGGSVYDEFEVMSGVLVDNIGLQYMPDNDGAFRTEINLENIFTNATEYRVTAIGQGLKMYRTVGDWFPRNNSDPTWLGVYANDPISSTITVEARSNPDEVPASYIIQLKTNQAPEFIGYQPLWIKKGTTISLNAADWFIDPDGDPITLFTGSVFGSPSVTLNNPSPSSPTVISVTADVYKGYTELRLFASDGLPGGTSSEYEYPNVDVNIVDEILSFGKGERQVSYNISDYVTDMNSGSLTAYLVESSSSLIESTSLSGTTLRLNANEDTLVGSEPVTVRLSDGVTSEYIDLFMIKNMDEQVIFQPQSMNASIDISSYLSGMTGTVTANVYTPFHQIQSVSLSDTNLIVTAKPDALGGSEDFVVQVSDGIITKYISVLAIFPVHGFIDFPLNALTTTLDMTHYTVGMTGTVTATVYGGSHPLIKSVSFTNNVLTLTAHNLGGDQSDIPVNGSESIIILLTDENMVTRRFVFHVFIPMAPPLEFSN